MGVSYRVQRGRVDGKSDDYHTVPILLLYANVRVYIYIYELAGLLSARSRSLQTPVGAIHRTIVYIIRKSFRQQFDLAGSCASVFQYTPNRGLIGASEFDDE